MSELPHLSEPLSDQLEAVAPQTAVDHGASMAAGAVAQASGRGVAAFAPASTLRQATARLRKTLPAEAGSEAESALMEVRFRAATQLLVTGARRSAQRLRAPGPIDVTHRDGAAVIERGLKRWLDPYAASAAGTAELALWSRELAGLPPGLAPLLHPLRQAMDTASAAGAAWDAAATRRAAAIASRVAAQNAWTAAVDALVTVAGDGPWLDPIRHAPRDAAHLDHWFEDGAPAEE
jgi:hypothetical protein